MTRNCFHLKNFSVGKTLTPPPNKNVCGIWISFDKIKKQEILPVSTPKVRYTWYISVTTIPMDSPRAETSPPRITLHRHPNWTMKNRITTPIMSHENIATMRKSSKYKEWQVLINLIIFFWQKPQKFSTALRMIFALNILW